MAIRSKGAGIAAMDVISHTTSAAAATSSSLNLRSMI